VVDLSTLPVDLAGRRKFPVGSTTRRILGTVNKLFAGLTVNLD
jgi:hypothetical protein